MDAARAQALDLFALTPPYTRAQLDRVYEQLRVTWHPPRFANLTNHPAQYMRAYQKAEAMTRRIESAYALLASELGPHEQSE